MFRNHPSTSKLITQTMSELKISLSNGKMLTKNMFLHSFYSFTCIYTFYTHTRSELSRMELITFFQEINLISIWTMFTN